MDAQLKNKILTENVREHALEAEIYDFIHNEIFNRYEQERIRKNLREIVKNKKIKYVLDVGSGTGNLVKNLFLISDNKDISIDAVDISAEMQQAMMKKVNSKNIKYILSDIDSYLSKRKKKYDLIMVSSVLHHLPDYQSTLIALLKKLNKKGVLFITHEGLNSKLSSQSISFKIIDFFDVQLQRSFLLFHVLTGKLKLKRLLALDTSFSDYHVGNNGLYPELIKSKIDRNDYFIFIKQYCTGYFLAKLKNKLRFKNNFDMIITRK